MSLGSMAEILHSDLASHPMHSCKQPRAACFTSKELLLTKTASKDTAPPIECCKGTAAYWCPATALGSGGREAREGLDVQHADP